MVDDREVVDDPEVVDNPEVVDEVDDMEVVVDDTQLEARRNARTSIPQYTSTPGLTQDMNGKTILGFLPADS